MSIPVVRPFQGAPARLQNRIVTTDQSLLVPSDVTELTAQVFFGGRLVKTLTIDADDVLFSTLQVANGWSRDAIGYNFEYVVAGDAFKHEGGRQYTLEFKAVTLAEPVKWSWILHYQPWNGVQ